MKCFSNREKKKESLRTFHFNEKKTLPLKDWIAYIKNDDVSFFEGKHSYHHFAKEQKLTIIETLIKYNKKSFVKALPTEFIESIDFPSLGDLYLKTDRTASRDAFEALSDKMKGMLALLSARKLILEIHKGDLIYGVQEDRKRLMDEIYKTSQPVVDKLNNQILDIKNGHYYGLYGAKTLEALSHAFYVEAHPRYNPNRVENADLDVRNKRIKKFCKAGITRILESQSPNRIHFLLGKWEPLSAFKKSDKKIYFTNSEFRLVFREWLKNPILVDEKIVFWTRDYKKQTPTDLFESIGKNIDYIPKSAKEESTQKILEWTSRKPEMTIRKEARNDKEGSLLF
jgi:hypothetical protein